MTDSIFSSILSSPSQTNSSIKLSGQKAQIKQYDHSLHSTMKERQDYIMKQKQDEERLKLEAEDMTRRQREELMTKVEIRKRIQEFRKVTSYHIISYHI